MLIERGHKGHTMLWPEVIQKFGDETTARKYFEMGAVKQLPAPAGQQWGEYVIDRKFYSSRQVYSEGFAVDGQNHNLTANEFESAFGVLEALALIIVMLVLRF